MPAGGGWGLIVRVPDLTTREGALVASLYGVLTIAWLYVMVRSIRKRDWPEFVVQLLVFPGTIVALQLF